MSENGNGFGKLAAALVRAQAEFPVVPKSGKNPHLGVSYATLDDVITAVRGPLAKNGLAFSQLLSRTEDGEPVLRTVLIHESGETFESDFVIRVAWESKGVNALQSLGGTVTYLKRIALSALLGIATGEDADGEGAAGSKPAARGKGKSPSKATDAREDPSPKGVANPQQLLDAVNAETGDYYRNLEHMAHALAKITGKPVKGWPGPKATEAYEGMFEKLVEYGQSQRGSATVDRGDEPAPAEEPVPAEEPASKEEAIDEDALPF